MLFRSKIFTQKKSRFITFQVLCNRFAEKFYAQALVKLMAWKYIVIAVFVVALVFMMGVFGKVGLSLFPKAEKPMILVDVVTPPNSSLSYTQNVMQEVSDVLKAQPEVAHVAQNIGNSNPRIYYNEIPERGVANYGQQLVLLHRFDAQESKALVEKLRRQFNSWHQAKIKVKEFTQGPVTDQPITIRLISDSLEDLAHVSQDLARFMAKQAGIINIENPIGQANTELKVDIDYDKAAMLGISIHQLDLTLQTLVSGSSVGLFSDSNGESYPVVVRGKNLDMSLFERAFISTSSGDEVPMSQVVSLSLVQGKTEFFHYQKQRMSKVSADVAQGYSIAELTEQVVQFIDNYDLPTGMYYSLGGEEESRKESFSGLSQIMIITAVGIFAVLVLQFKSFLQPLIIFSSIPFAIAGSGLGLYLGNLSFSMMAFIGLISLFGIVVNNAIILIDTANKNLVEQSDKCRAIVDASITRFTPILLTTLTTIFGLLPLTMFGGGLWQPLGVVIISGLCVSAVASFLLVPVLTELFTRKK